MTAMVIAALCAGISGIIGAVFTGLAQLRHQANGDAHNGEGHQGDENGHP